MTEVMERVLAEAKAYGDWFSILHRRDSPVVGRWQTIEALYRRGLLERRAFTHYRVSTRNPLRRRVQYRFKE